MIDLMGKINKAFRLAYRRRSREPREIQIELTNRCNSACEMCPHTTGEIPAIDFPIEYLDLILSATPEIADVVLTGWGEPLLHPDFMRFVEKIRREWSSARIRFTTNGLALDSNLCETLAEKGVATVTVSIDLWPGLSSTDPFWKRYCHPASDQVVKNIRALGEVRRVNGHPSVRLQALALPALAEHTRSLIDLAAEEQLDEVNLVRLLPSPDHKDVRPPWDEEQELLRELIRYGKQKKVRVRSINRQPLWLRIIRGGEDYCLKTDDSVYVTAEGEITPCCNLRSLSYGNVQELSGNIPAAWRRPAWNKFFHNQREVCGCCDALDHRYACPP